MCSDVRYLGRPHFNFALYIFSGPVQLFTNRLYTGPALCMDTLITTRAYARAVLGVAILSVRLCVRLSHACIVTKLNDALQIFLYHTKGQSLCYSDTKSGWSATPPSL